MRGEDVGVVVTGTITTTTTGSTPLVVTITTIMGTTGEEETGTTTTRDRPGVLPSTTSNRCSMVDSMRGTTMEDAVEWPTMEVDSGTITVTRGISPRLLSTITRTIHSIIIRTASKALQTHQRTMSRLMTSKSRIHRLLVLIQWLSPVVVTDPERVTRTWTVRPITAAEDDTRIRHGTRNYQLAIRKSRKS